MKSSIMFLILRATHAIQWSRTMRCKLAIVSQSVKYDLSLDCSLQLKNMKPELLVISSQPYGGESSISLTLTARHTEKIVLVQRQEIVSCLSLVP